MFYVVRLMSDSFSDKTPVPVVRYIEQKTIKPSVVPPVASVEEVSSPKVFAAPRASAVKTESKPSK